MIKCLNVTLYSDAGSYVNFNPKDPKDGKISDNQYSGVRHDDKPGINGMVTIKVSKRCLILHDYYYYY